MLYLVRKKKVNFILSYYTNLTHTGQEKITSFFRMVYTRVQRLGVLYDSLAIPLLSQKNSQFLKFAIFWGKIEGLFQHRFIFILRKIVQKTISKIPQLI